MSANQRSPVIALCLAALVAMPVFLGAASAQTQDSVDEVIVHPVLTVPDTSFLIAQMSHSPTPGVMWNGHIGPGAPLHITFPGDSAMYICTANWVWTDQSGALYLGTAGHCVLPGDQRTTHGDSGTIPPYDPSGVRVWVCIGECVTGGFLGGTEEELLDNYLEIGPVAYGRQKPPNGGIGEGTDGQGIGHDFGIVRIPNQYRELVDPSMPFWGGPDGRFDADSTGEAVVFHGSGAVYGETFATKSRAGVSLGSDAFSWEAGMMAYGGDSGSAVSIQPRNEDGPQAHGLLTHGVLAGPLIYGLVNTRAIEMARVDAGLCIRPLMADENVFAPAPPEPVPGICEAVPPPPVEELVATILDGPYSGETGEAIAIEGTATGGESEQGFTCTWESLQPGAVFGDASSCSTTVRYNNAGLYRIRLTVEDGTQTATDLEDVLVEAPPPVEISQVRITAPVDEEQIWRDEQIMVTGTVFRAATQAPVESGCADDPAGDAVFVIDPLVVDPWDITRLCAAQTSGAFEVEVEISGADIQDLMGDAASPVIYSVAFDSGQTFDLFKWGLEWGVYRYPDVGSVAEGMVESAVVTVSGTAPATLHLTLPMNEVGGTPSALHAYTHGGEPFLGLNANYLTGEEAVVVDRAPDEGDVMALRTSSLGLWDRIAAATAGDAGAQQTGGGSLSAPLGPQSLSGGTGSGDTESPPPGAERVELYLEDDLVGWVEVATQPAPPELQWDDWQIAFEPNATGMYALRAEWWDGPSLIDIHEISVDVRYTARFGPPEPSGSSGMGAGGDGVPDGSGDNGAAFLQALGPCPFGMGEGCVPAWANVQGTEPSGSSEVPPVLRHEPQRSNPVIMDVDEAGEDPAASAGGLGLWIMVGLLAVVVAIAVAAVALRRRDEG